MEDNELDELIGKHMLIDLRTWVQDLFEGQLVSITRCLTCERTSSREEKFMNLSVDISKNVSLNHCLKKFSTKELLNLTDKFYCESCNAKQVATRQMMIKKRP
jgi:ubiquitin C-terminal hydrolase